MASYLGNLNNNPPSEFRNKKFIRAVNSFLKQSYENSELIIVSDGCEITKKIYDENWFINPRVKFFMSAKQPLYSGGIRAVGQKLATGDIICYLDNDDLLGKDHIKTIVDQFDINEYDFVYYNDYLALNKEFNKFQTRIVEARYASIGTSSIAHINFEKKYKTDHRRPTWMTMNGYGHDYMYVMRMVSYGCKFKKLDKAPSYIVCHYAGFDA